MVFWLIQNSYLIKYDWRQFLCLNRFYDKNLIMLSTFYIITRDLNNLTNFIIVLVNLGVSLTVREL